MKRKTEVDWAYWGSYGVLVFAYAALLMLIVVTLVEVFS